MSSISKVSNICDQLRKFDHLCNNNDYISITQWSNGEGWDISIGSRMFSLTFGELDAINYLTKKLEYDSED